MIDENLMRKVVRLNKLENFIIEQAAFLDKYVLEQSKEYSLLEEADSFKYDLIEEILALCDDRGSKQDLVDSIYAAYERSFVEL